MKVAEVDAKSVLTKSKLPASEYCINPYLGCSHGCKYCYSRFIGRWRGHREPWGSYVDVRKSAPVVLQEELRRVKKKGLVLLGSVTDAYQPLEHRYGLTRNMLGQLVEAGFPISILTKSDLVTRDIDILKKADYCEVGFSVSFLDDYVRHKMEPGAASIDRRLAALKKIHDEGIRTYVFVGPIFPELTDFKDILSRVSADVDFVMGESLNIWCGNWTSLEPVLSELLCEHVRIYKRMIMSDTVWENIEGLFRERCTALGLPLEGFFRHRPHRRRM